MDASQPRRPVFLGPDALASFADGADPAQLAEAAHSTAALLVDTGRRDAEATQRLVQLVDDHGLELVASLWADRPARTLPGVLWRLYVLRDWVRRDPAGATADYEAGRHVADVARVVAGAEEPPTAAGLEHLLDEVLGGVFRGDLAVALERAGAFCRVIAAGRAHRTDDLESARRAASLLDTADDLEAGARLWRVGELV